MPEHVDTQADPLPAAVTSARSQLKDVSSAIARVVEGLDLEAVLRHIVEAGMALAEARYGALGVIAPDGRSLERFIHVGMDPATARHIGALPSGAGLLGAVITDQASIRLAHLHDDPRSSGFPQAHPGMDSFLGVPIRVGERVYGNLYLTQSRRGEFSPHDEELVQALAATAGMAIENARLYEQSRARGRWSTATADVLSGLLDADGDQLLEEIVHRMGDFMSADAVSFVVPHGTDQFKIATAHGAPIQVWEGVTYPAANTLTEQALLSRGVVRADARPSVKPGLPPIASTVVIPLFSGDECLGFLVINRNPDHPPFTDADADMAAQFGLQAGAAIEIVRARKDRRRLELSRERTRVAEEIHDQVIQRLFGAGMSLQAVSATVDRRAAAAIEAQVDALDAAIKDVRTVIFALSSNERPPTDRLRDRVLDVLTDMAPAMSTTPRLTFHGALDSLVSDALADDLTAVLRECLTNVVKHADAGHVDVELGVHDGVVTLAVADDGRGMGSSTRVSGVGNMADRARLLGGTCTITPRDGGGTRVEWSVPLTDVRKERST